MTAMNEQKNREKWHRYYAASNSSTTVNENTSQGLYDKMGNDLSRILLALTAYGQRGLANPENIANAVTLVAQVTKAINGELAQDTANNKIFKAAQNPSNTVSSNNSEVAPQAKSVFVPRPG